jgi:hypothetical protein
MHAQELSLEVPSQGARRATGEGSQNGWQQPQRFSARQQTEAVLRLLHGEALDILSRERGILVPRLATWPAAVLAAGQAARKKPPLESRAQALVRLRQKLGAATMAIALLSETLGRLETHRP